MFARYDMDIEGGGSCLGKTSRQSGRRKDLVDEQRVGVAHDHELTCWHCRYISHCLHAGLGYKQPRRQSHLAQSHIGCATGFPWETVQALQPACTECISLPTRGSLLSPRGSQARHADITHQSSYMCMSTFNISGCRDAEASAWWVVISNTVQLAPWLQDCKGAHMVKKPLVAKRNQH